MAKLTDEQFKELNHYFQTVWHEIGMDCLQATADSARMDGEVFRTKYPAEEVSMSRAEVIDVVLDQGCEFQYRTYNAALPSPETQAAWKAMSHHQHNTLARKMFPYKTYGA